MDSQRATEIKDLLRARNQKGLALLYDHYANALNGIAINIVGSPAVAEEVLQRAFLKIWKNFDQYDETKSTLFTWMARITRNSAIDQRRLKSHEHALKTESIDLHVDDRKEEAVSSAKIDVDRLLSDMDEDQRNVLRTVYLEGYSHSQAAEFLGMPLGSVKTKLRSSIKILREKVRKDKKYMLGLILLLLMLIGLLL